MAAERVRLDSKFQTEKKRSKKHPVLNDGINELPDEILVDIISFLSFKEAARTSVLSSRWRNLWKQSPSLSLDFDADSALVKMKQHVRTLLSPSERGIYINRERRKYIKWVNGIIRSCKADTLKEFRVCFDFDNLLFSKSITRWVEFALARHVQKLVLDFSPKPDYGYSPTHYAFPENLLSSSSIDDFKSLKQVCFKCVNVTGEAIEFFLANCPLLEELVVVSTAKILNLQVCGPSLALKHLEMGYCFYLKSVRISAPNLTSLSVHKVEQLFLENVPKLVEISANCMYRDDSVNNLRAALSWRIFQLEILTLGFNYKTEVKFLSSFPQLPKLNKLVIQYWTGDDLSLMPLTFLIRAAPNLQEFVVELKRVGAVRFSREDKSFAQFLHEHLKVFKLGGYHGGSSDVELVTYIFNNCVLLEKIIIDPNEETSFSPSPPTPKQLHQAQIATDSAKKQLQAQLPHPHHVELLIL